MSINFSTKNISRRAALFASVSTSAALLLSALLPQNVQPALAAPAFQMPFPCGQTWIGSTRSNHNPVYSVDFNRTDDDGDPVVAAAAGTISRIANLGDTSYGRYMIVDHGGGWTTLYAHLSATYGSVGSSVARGTRIGLVGNTGGSTGAHLHFEERYNGNAVKAVFNGSQVYYYDSSQTLTSRNC